MTKLNEKKRVKITRWLSAGTVVKIAPIKGGKFTLDKVAVALNAHDEIELSSGGKLVGVYEYSESYLGAALMVEGGIAGVVFCVKSELSRG